MKCSGSAVIEEMESRIRGVKGSSEKICHKGAKTQKNYTKRLRALVAMKKSAIQYSRFAVRCSMFEMQCTDFEVRTRNRSRRGNI